MSTPLNSDEINNIMYKMIEVRAQQNAEFHAGRLSEATGTPKQPISFDRPLSLLRLWPWNFGRLTT